ncbi:MAG: tRNA (N(6)-L-threonylcarbamoyladenosine(37)-C(2))-methylthiotransferase MtaB [Oscillospiraceae bacterium]|nr:tRNA (N(6)-L-threonylcarbamoyladenosine(37)-C(2))-methylthiotransferase MtaB [Oscillospiraceae bacterium]
MKFGFYTLGCKVNQYETQAMEQLLAAKGHTIAPFDEPCDGYIINTCTVTATGDKKSRNAVRRAKKCAPDAVIGVCGCYAQLHAQSAAALGADVVGGSGERTEFIENLLRACSLRQAAVSVPDAMTRRTFELLPAGSLAGRTRAMLKVEDGCHNFCSYCIIPYARGPVRSMALPDAVRAAEGLAAAGYHELVLTGIELSSWGTDLPEPQPLTALISAVCRAAPALRVRLGSLEPRTVTAEFCAAIAALPNLCPQFHLSLQSGCDRTLREMHRRYDTARYRESVRLLRDALPGCAITTDLIVGFPGETEADFAQTLAFLQEIGFAAVHVFPYSRRAGTPAAKMDGQVTREEKADRAGRASKVAAQSAAAYHRAMIGTQVPVLFEQAEGVWYTGHAPNYVKVFVQEQAAQNQVRTVTVTGLCAQGVTAVLD